MISISDQRKNGKVFLVGAGPGDRKLITLRGRECLESADVVIYDLLANTELLDHCPPHAEKIFGGKKAGEQTKRQIEIDRLLVQHAKAGKTVVRLKGGDPFVFGRGGEEALTLVDAGVDFEVVPGITSAIAAPAYAGIPVTHRGYASSVAFVTGHTGALEADSEIRWEQLATAVDTLVIYMGVGHLREIGKRLIACGRKPETPVALVHWGTLPQQIELQGTLADIAERAHATKLKNPAVIVIGNVTLLRERIQWYDKRPLFGRRIMVTRAREQASEFSTCLESYGANVVEFPTIAIEPIQDNPLLWQAINDLGDYNWVIFTSANSVQFFFSKLQESGKDVRSFAAAQICAIGPKTVEALSGIGIRADFVPSQSLASIIATEIAELSRKRILIPHAKIATDELPEALRKNGALVDAIAIYDTLKTVCDRRYDIEREMLGGDIDMVTFTSSSTVKNFVEMFTPSTLRGLTEKLRIAVIGPSTAETAREHALSVDVMPKMASVEALTEEIVRYYKGD